MVRKVTLRQMGGSVGATIPKDMAERLHVRAGDEVFVIDTEKKPARGECFRPVLRRCDIIHHSS